MVFLTAGAAGMYCGSCMHDNATAKALVRRGIDCLLQPVYTPIKTDESSIAGEQVFFGGIHIYATQRWPWLSSLPRLVRGWLDAPSLIRWVTSKTHSADPEMLGQLTLSMLRGEQGRQADEVHRLVEWLAKELKPDAIILSNLLIGGSLPSIRRALPETPIAVILQGDDIFLDHLPEQLRVEAYRLLQDFVPSVDHFITNSNFYAEKMGDLLKIPETKRVVLPLTIDTTPFPTPTQAADIAAGSTATSNEFRIGYLARIAPEKGLHHLVDAFVRMASTQKSSGAQLHVAGWLGDQNRDYFASQVKKIAQAGLIDRFVHHGSPGLEDKVDFLRNIDLLCVPTEYEDPKGLFVLEALAAGTPVLQPNHGAFGELIDQTGGGKTFAAGDIDEIVRLIGDLQADRQQLRALGVRGQRAVHDNHTVDRFADSLIELLLTAPE